MAWVAPVGTLGAVTVVAAEAAAVDAADAAVAGATASATAVGRAPPGGLLRLELLRRRRRLCWRAATRLPLLGIATPRAPRRRRAFVSAICSQNIDGNGDCNERPSTWFNNTSKRRVAGSEPLAGLCQWCAARVTIQTPGVLHKPQPSYQPTGKREWARICGFRIKSGMTSWTQKWPSKSEQLPASFGRARLEHHGVHKTPARGYWNEPARADGEQIN